MVLVHKTKKGKSIFIITRIALKVCKCNNDSHTPTDSQCVAETRDGFNYSGIQIGLTGVVGSELAWGLPTAVIPQ